jgi:chemotaxis protein histidine kinase CheA
MPVEFQEEPIPVDETYEEAAAYENYDEDYDDNKEPEVALEPHAEPEAALEPQAAAAIATTNSDNTDLGNTAYPAYSESRTALDLPPVPQEPHPEESETTTETEFAHVETRPLPPTNEDFGAAVAAAATQTQIEEQRHQSKVASQKEAEEILAEMREETKKEQFDAAVQSAAAKQIEDQKAQQRQAMREESERILADMRQEDEEEKQRQENQPSGFNRYAVEVGTDAAQPQQVQGQEQTSTYNSSTEAATPWIAYVDKDTGSTYWYNNDTGESSWVEPIGIDYVWGEQTDGQYEGLMKDARNANYGPMPHRVVNDSGKIKRMTSTASGLNDGLGSDFLSTTWVEPTKEAAELFVHMNMFGNGKASLCGTKVHEFGTTSVGVRAMFELFISLTKMFLFACIMVIPACVVYDAGVGSEYVWDFTQFTSLSAASSGLSESTTTKITIIDVNGTATTTTTVSSPSDVQLGSLAGVSARTASEIVSAFDLFTSIGMFMYLVYIRHYLLKIAKEVHLETAQASSYTVELSEGLPTDCTEDELMEHFNRLYALNKVDHKGRKIVKKVTLHHERAKYEAKLSQSKKKQEGNTPVIQVYAVNGGVVPVVVDENSPGHPLHADFGDDEEPIENVDHHGDEKYLGSWVSDVVLIRDEGDIIRHYQHLAKLDVKVRHQRALVKRVSPGTAYEKGPNETKADRLMKTLLKLEFQQQQGLMGFQDPGPNTLPVIRAFVTFNHEESYQRCVVDYDEAWRRHRCCPCCPGHPGLRLRYKHVMKVAAAPEPSDILYENQGEYVHKCAHRWRFWSSLCVIGLVLVVSLLLIVATYVVKDTYLQTASSPGGTEQMCGSELPTVMSSAALATTAFQYTRDRTQDVACQQSVNTLDARYLTIAGAAAFPSDGYNISICSPTFHSCVLDKRRSGAQLCPCFRPNDVSQCKQIESDGTEVNKTPKTGDLAVCYCIQRLNFLNNNFGNSAQALQELVNTDGDMCSGWLEASGIAAGWSTAASFVIAVVNAILGITISKKSESARPASISVQNSEIFIIYFMAQLFNSVVLTILINAEVVMEGIDPWGEHSDFTRSWFASAGAALTSTMLVLAFTSHIYPMLQYLHFRSARKQALKNAAKFVSQSELNNKCIGTEYGLQYRLTSVMIPVSTAILFGSFLPLLYVIALFAVFLAFWIDKTLIVKVSWSLFVLSANTSRLLSDRLLS